MASRSAVLVLADSGQPETELRSALFARARPDPTAHALDELAAHEQADPGTRGSSRGFRGSIEELEQLLAGLRGQALALVEDARRDTAILRPRQDLDMAALRAVLGGVAEQVLQDLADVQLLSEDER
jgi:hypothetical protein